MIYEKSDKKLSFFDFIKNKKNLTVEKTTKSTPAQYLMITNQLTSLMLGCKQKFHFMFTISCNRVIVPKQCDDAVAVL